MYLYREGDGLRESAAVHVVASGRWLVDLGPGEHWPSASYMSSSTGTSSDDTIHPAGMATTTAGLPRQLSGTAPHQWDTQWASVSVSASPGLVAREEGT